MVKLAKIKFWNRIQAMAIEVGGHKAGNDFSVAVNRAVEPVEGRLRCIE